MKSTIACLSALSFFACAAETAGTKVVDSSRKTTVTKTVTTTYTPQNDTDLATCRMVRVHFETEGSTLQEMDKPALNRLATCLKENRSIKVSIEGNADERGPDNYNQDLADNRASSVESYLLSEGVSSQQLSTMSFGRDNPRCTAHNESCWQANRRAVARPTSAHR